MCHPSSLTRFAMVKQKGSLGTDAGAGSGSGAKKARRKSRIVPRRRSEKARAKSNIKVNAMPIANGGLLDPKLTV